MLGGRSLAALLAHPALLCFLLLAVYVSPGLACTAQLLDCKLGRSGLLSESSTSWNWDFSCGVTPKCVYNEENPPENRLEQSHLFFSGEALTEMVVSFVSSRHADLTEDCAESFVTYQPVGSVSSFVSTAVGFVEEKPDKLVWRGLVHKVFLRGLQFATTYHYTPVVVDVCRNATWMGARHEFTTVAEHPQQVTLALVGDMGVDKNAEATVDSMTKDVRRLAAVLHAGDLSYAGGEQAVNDQWGNLIEKVAASVPYMVSPGNHEGSDVDFIPFVMRHHFPPPSPMFNSYDIPHAHILSFYQPTMNQEQLSFIQNDLRAAHAARNGSNDFIIVVAHHPMYSSSSGHGSTTGMRAQLEPLFDECRVDFAVWGHDHNYERTYPLFDGKVTSTNSGSCRQPYLRGNGTVHLVVGNAGRHLRNAFVHPQPDWSFIRKVEFGHTQLTLFANGTASLVSILNANRAVLDELWIHPSVVSPEKEKCPMEEYACEIAGCPDGNLLVGDPGVRCYYSGYCASVTDQSSTFHKVLLVIGVVVGVLVCAALLGLIGLFMWKKRVFHRLRRFDRLLGPDGDATENL